MITAGERFLKCFDFMLGNEGGFSNHPNDYGGATMCGVSFALASSMFRQGSIWLDINKNGKFDKNDLLHLTIDQIKRIYHEQFWKPISKIADIMQDLTLPCKVFDAAVNIGLPHAIKLLQQAVGVESDGVLGKQTLKAINHQDEKVTLEKFINNLVLYYNRIALKDPSQKVFLKGWESRAKRLPYWS